MEGGETQPWFCDTGEGTAVTVPRAESRKLAMAAGRHRGLPWLSGLTQETAQPQIASWDGAGGAGGRPLSF